MKLDKWPEEIECEGCRMSDQPKYGEWIKCSERLPEVGVEVLIFGNRCNEPPKILGVKAMFFINDNWNTIGSISKDAAARVSIEVAE